MIVDDHDASCMTRNPWKLCSQNQVEQVKLILRLIPVWMCCLMFAVVQSFFQPTFTKQGSTMVRSIGSNFNLRQPDSYSCHSNLCSCFCPNCPKIHGTVLWHHHLTKNRHWPISVHNHHGCVRFGRSEKGQHCKRTQPLGQPENNSANESVVVNSTVHGMRFI